MECPKCGLQLLQEFLFEEHFRNCRVGTSPIYNKPSNLKRPPDEVLEKVHIKKVRLDDIDREYKLCDNPDCYSVGHHWCTYPAIKFQNGVYKTKGTILKNASLLDGVPRYTQFFNSLNSLGCIFTFKYIGGNHPTIKIKSMNVMEQKFNYELKLLCHDHSSKIKGFVGEEERTVVILNFDSPLIEYDLILNPKFI